MPFSLTASMYRFGWRGKSLVVRGKKRTAHGILPWAVLRLIKGGLVEMATPASAVAQAVIDTVLS